MIECFPKLMVSKRGYSKSLFLNLKCLSFIVNKSATQLGVRSFFTLHYASAIYRYEKEFAIRFREHLSFLSLDDKHTIKIGEPGCPVAAVERGKSVLVAMGKRLEEADHDVTGLSMTPSVSLLGDVPDSIEGSFHHGKVFVTLKENAFQPSSPIRHMSELNELLSQLGTVKPILVLYTDGGPDHRLTYLSVQLSLLAIFKELDLDFLCAVRTPPQHSWKNPVERIMSILNLAFSGSWLYARKSGT